MRYYMLFLGFLLFAAPAADVASQDVGFSGALAVQAGESAAFVRDVPGGAERFLPPVRPLRLLRPFEKPAHRYGPGHRGVDLAAVPGQEVFAPRGGTVRFVGTVAGRPLISVEFPDAGVYAIEPVESELRKGDAVSAGQLLGVVSRGGDCDGVCVHFGVRIAGEYVNPALWLFGRPRLLPLAG